MRPLIPPQQQTQSISFAVFDDLPRLLEAMGNKLEREWPESLSKAPRAKFILLNTARLAEWTYRTVKYFSADTPPEPARKPEFASSIGPLSRTILDSVCMVVFLFDDLEKRTEWFHKSAWREIKEEYNRVSARYSADKDMAPWFSKHQKFMESIKTDWGITAEEAEDPEKAKIRYFPHPGTMKDQLLDQARKDFFHFLDGWIYKDLSADSHGSWRGLARRMGVILEDSEDFWRRYRTRAIDTLLVVVLSLLSEIEMECRFGLSKRIDDLWQNLIVGNLTVVGKDLYDHRYAGRLRVS